MSITNKFFPFCLGVIITISTLSSCHSSKGLTGNPYIDGKEKPSQKQAEETKRVTKKGNKAYKKQIEENQDNIADNNKKFFKMRKHYKHKKAKKQKKTRS